MTILTFAPFQSQVPPQLWHSLTALKLDVLRLDDAPRDICAGYAPARETVDRLTGERVGLGCWAMVEDMESAPTNAFPIHGTLKNFNTLEDFKSSDKAALFDSVAVEIAHAPSTSALNRLLLLTFADLKKYKYYYWFAFPALLSQPAWEVAEPGLQLVDEALAARVRERLTEGEWCFLVKGVEKGNVEVGWVDDWETFFEGVPEDERILAFHDPSTTSSPGWPLRNLLYHVRRLHSVSRVRVLAWRGDDGARSLVGDVFLLDGAAAPPPVPQGQTPQAVGWEKNAQGKLAPRVADLGPSMDPRRLADQAVDLNLKLMKWRILPELDLDRVSSTRCLLLGAGTLGCYVARTLMGWGVRTVTFVDSGRVSFSNPVRQPLFEFEDCLDGGKPKAACAAERLAKVYPGVNATGHTLSIPMPGHPVPKGQEDKVAADIATLEKLFDEHDAVFLLMDSRESRWFPTLLGAAKNKIVLNAALGFDSYLVMRHGSGVGAQLPEGRKRLGCYYCNDIVAPADSLTDRTLDQMCTVTRPGLAGMAGASAVELLVSVLQHSQGILAPAPPPPSTAPEQKTAETEAESVLGVVPHQIRGFLARFQTMLIAGQAYDRCTACSDTVVREYLDKGKDMLLKAFNESDYLEKLTGLDKMKAETDAALEAVDWGVEGESGEDDF